MAAKSTVPARGPVRKNREPSAEEISVRVIESARADILKTHAARGQATAVPYQDEADEKFSGIGALEPPYSPFVLLTLLEHSNSLRQCVDSYVTNIDAHGHRFEPVVDLDAADADARIKSYLLSRAAEKDPATVDNPGVQLVEPSADQIETCKKELAERMRVEKQKIENFFEFACLDYSFVTLRRRTRQDIETLGNAYWEVIRNEAGEVAGFEYVPGFTMRHMKADTHATTVNYRVKANEFNYTSIPARRRFRRFVQVFESQLVWFKEFGDPRTLSRTSGAIYPDIEALRKQEGEQAEPASEMIHFRVHTPKTSYGIPRWVGVLLSVLGSRHAEEVNLTYFENKSVPPLAVLVSGGRITNETVNRIKDFIDNDIKGKKNFHKILVIEGESSGMSGFDQGRLKLDLKPLTAAQHNDALFQNYDERNIDKVGMSFRLPRMLRGDIRDFNRATAEAALQFAESQVFKPERDEFDFTINRKILPALSVRFWRFKSNGADAQSPTELAEIGKKLGDAGFLTPAEGRELASKVLNRELQRIDAPWVKQPLSLTQAGVVPPDQLIAPGMTTPQNAAQGGPAPGATAPLGGAAMNGAAAPAPAPTTAGVNLTGTDAASCITVNEYRQGVGYGPLKLPKSDQDDPDGYLTVAEFKAKRMALGQTQGTTEGQNAPAKNTVVQNASPLVDFATTLLALRKMIPMLEAADAKAQFERAQQAAEEIENADG